MKRSRHHKPCRPNPGRKVECKEKDNPTHKSINTEKDKYCDQIFDLAGDVNKLEESYKAHSDLMLQKRCLFVQTENHFRYLRNFNLTIGTEFLKTNDKISENIKSYVTKNTDLTSVLQQIETGVKDILANMTTLSNKATALKNCKNAACNNGQWKALTEGVDEQHEDEKGKHHRRKDHCRHVEEKYNALIDIPETLVNDADTLFKSASDVRGIQVFINLDSLEAIRKGLSENAQSLNLHMQTAMTTREADLKNIEKNLKDIISDKAESNVSRYGSRSNFEGAKRALNIICCPDEFCDCVDDRPNSESRLKACEKRICELCGLVKKVYCSEDESEEEPEEQERDNRGHRGGSEKEQF